MIDDKTLAVQGNDIRYLIRRGKNADAPVMLFLHGFPECAEAWLPLWGALSKDWTLVAPDMPSYQFSEPLNSDADYAVPALVSRLSEFATAVCGSSDIVLVGHDWGGAVAWPLAAFNSKQFSRLIILNAAHPSAFTRELNQNESQRNASRYINFLRNENATQRLIDDDFKLMRKMLTRKLNGTDYEARLEQAWAMPGRLQGMLGYYRAMPWDASLSDDNCDEAKLRIPSLTLSQPVLVLWGMRDTAFAVEVLDGLDEWVKKLKVVRHEQATHWIHREFPDWVAREIADWMP